MIQQSMLQSLVTPCIISIIVTPCIISIKCQQAVSYLYSAAIGSYYNILALDLTDLPVPSSIKICYLSHSIYFFHVQVP